MGSFSEVVLGFHFRRDTPAEVLAAFAALAEAPGTGGPQPLPEPVREPEPGWAPDEFHQGGGALAAYEPAPWRHDWAAWLGSSMSVAVCPSASLRWSELDRWYLSCRSAFKADPGLVHAFLRWLGPYIGDGLDPAPPGGEAPLLVGYIKHEYLEQPNLLWLRDGELQLAGVTDPAAVGGILSVVCGLPGSGREEYLADEWRRGGHAFDGYHHAAIGHDPHPMSSRYAGTVLRILEAGGTVTISDVAFCSGEVRDRVIGEFRRRMPDLLVQTIGFANDPAQCRRNVVARAAGEPGHDAAFDLDQIARFAPGYVPVGDVRPVMPWRPAPR